MMTSLLLLLLLPLPLPLPLLPFDSHYTGQPVLAGTPVNVWRILLERSFTARMPLLMASSKFELGRRR